jgi:DNA (cytosine-5)-methyltransferase 1
VFVVGCLGDWRAASAVLFERQSLSGDPAPSREKRKGITCTPEGIAGTISRKWSKGTGGPAGDEHYNLIVNPVYEMHGQDSRVREVGDVCTTVTQKYGTGGGNVPITIQPVASFRKSRRAQSVNHNETWVDDDVANTLNVFDVGDVRTTQAIVHPMAVRRLTPVECERLQGFPDNYTDIKERTPDGPRYKALGNSMAVPVMTWIGRRIKEVDELSKQKVA